MKNIWCFPLNDEIAPSKWYNIATGNITYIFYLLVFGLIISGLG